MSQITRALKKVQEQREKITNVEEDAAQIIGATINPSIVKDEVKEIPVEKDIPVVEQVGAVKNNSILLLTIGVVLAFAVSVFTLTLFWMSQPKQDRILGIQNTIEIENKKLVNLNNLLNKYKLSTNDQINHIDQQFDYKFKYLASDSKETYDNLKEAILDGKQDVNYLDIYTKKLDKQIQTVSAEVQQLEQANQPKAVTSDTGNL